MNKYEVTCYYQGYSTKNRFFSYNNFFGINDKANHIPRETKLIIAKAVKEMGYRPNKMAVGLVKNKAISLVLYYRILEISFFHIQLKF